MSFGVGVIVAAALAHKYTAPRAAHQQAGNRNIGNSIPLFWM